MRSHQSLRAAPGKRRARGGSFGGDFQELFSQMATKLSRRDTSACKQSGQARPRASMGSHVLQSSVRSIRRMAIRIHSFSLACSMLSVKSSQKYNSFSLVVVQATPSLVRLVRVPKGPLSGRRLCSCLLDTRAAQGPRTHPVKKNRLHRMDLNAENFIIL